MITIRDHDSALFDPWEYLGPKRRQILERSWAGVFRDFLLRHLPVKELATAFQKGTGRPSKDLHMALGALVLQQLHDLTDEQTVEAIALNVAWHYALDIRHESEAYLCERTLRNYRIKVIDAGLDQVLFRGLTDQLIEQLGVDTSKQRIDSTAVRSAIRGLTRLGILVEGMSRFLRELKRRDAKLFLSVDPEIVRRYVDRAGDGCFADTRPSESRRRLPEAARDVFALVEQFEATSANDLASFQLLQRIFDEQCEVVEDSPKRVQVRPPNRTGCDTVVSPADPDARYNKHRGTGYLVQIMETFAEDDVPHSDVTDVPKPDLITHVSVTPMTAHDKDALVPALADTIERSAQPTTLLADSHYGSTECVETGCERGVEIIAPAQTPKGKLQGKLTLEDFEIDDDGCVTRCPAGCEPESTSASSTKLQVQFAPATCENCDCLERCPAAPVGRQTSRYQYTPDRLQQRARRLKERSDEFRERYRWRAGVEATMSRFKHQMGMDSLRVRRMWRVAYTATLRALGLNIRRVASYRVATR